MGSSLLSVFSVRIAFSSGDRWHAVDDLVGLVEVDAAGSGAGDGAFQVLRRHWGRAGLDPAARFDRRHRGRARDPVTDHR
ncbi:hypothetical protein [Nonomuraea sp. NPDC049684]|uniref:hypothetical protein n=1 Tax=Nonomuraea sp. NPDC049684 TaxID=3364356 RepID=UPI0037B8B71D